VQERAKEAKRVSLPHRVELPERTGGAGLTGTVRAVLLRATCLTERQREKGVEFASNEGISIDGRCVSFPRRARVRATPVFLRQVDVDGKLLSRLSLVDQPERRRCVAGTEREGQAAHSSSFPCFRRCRRSARLSSLCSSRRRRE
jgi:hypothetical protein